VKIGYRRVSGLRIGNETFKLKSPKMAGCQKIFRERFPASIVVFCCVRSCCLK